MSNYYTVFEFIYKKASVRIRQKWIDANKPNQKYIITPNDKATDDQRQLFNYIVNGKIVTKTNPWFLTPTARDGIFAYFHFTDYSELLFGDHQEITSYSEELFKMLLDECILDPNTDFDMNDLLILLCDYIPYAKNVTLTSLLTNSNIGTKDRNFRELLFGYTLEELNKDNISITAAAHHYLFMQSKEWFIKEFESFIEKIDSYKNFPKKIGTFVKEKFIIKLKEHTPNYHNSLGIRIKVLLETDLSIADKEIKVFAWKNEEEKFKYDLFRASLNYVNELEDIFQSKVLTLTPTNSNN